MFSVQTDLAVPYFFVLSKIVQFSVKNVWIQKSVSSKTSAISSHVIIPLRNHTSETKLASQYHGTKLETLKATNSPDPKVGRFRRLHRETVSKSTFLKSSVFQENAFFGVWNGKPPKPNLHRIPSPKRMHA